MKKITILFVLLAIAVTGFTQQIVSPQKFSSTDYLKKSKNQKTAAWLLLGGGVTLMTVGSAIATKEIVEDLGNLFTAEEEKSSNTGGVLLFTGLVSSLGSIPFFISSSSNKRKGLSMSASIKMDNTTSVYKYGMTRNSYPALSLKINL